MCFDILLFGTFECMRWLFQLPILFRCVHKFLSISYTYFLLLYSFGWFVEMKLFRFCLCSECYMMHIYIYIWFSMSVFHDFQRALSRLCAFFDHTTNGNNRFFFFYVDSILSVHSMWNTANGHFMSWTCKLCHDTYNKMKVTLK